MAAKHGPLPRGWLRTFLGMVACGLLMASGAASAQDRLNPSAPVLPEEKALPAPERLVADPVVRTAPECGIASPAASGLSGWRPCPFAANSIGLNLGRRVDLPNGELTVKFGFARGNDAALSLDQQLRRSSASFREGTLLTMGSEARLLGGRLRLTSDLGWSRTHERGPAKSADQPGRPREESGFSQLHGFELTALDRPGVRWKIDGAISRSSDDFRTDSIYGIGTLLAGDGDSERLSSRLDLGKFRLRAALAGTRTIVSRNSTRSVSLGYGGIALSLVKRQGRTLPQDSYPTSLSQTGGTSLSLDFDFYSLAPLLAMQDRGLATLLPKQVTLTAGQRETLRPGSALRPVTHRKSLGAFALWTTPLGDTMVDYSRDRLADPLGIGIEKSSQLMINHNVKLGGWRIGLDLLSLKTRAANGDDDSTLYYSASVSRTFASGARLKLDLGRDAQSFGGLASDFTLRDKSHRAKLELDLSQPLQRRLANQSVHFTLAAQVRLSNSDYQLRFLDEVIDRGSDGYARQGVFAAFGYRF
jgi:hypothetical protein